MASITVGAFGGTHNSAKTAESYALWTYLTG